MTPAAAQDHADARSLLLADGEFAPHDSLTSMVRTLLLQRDGARRVGASWRAQVMAVAEADARAAGVSAEQIGG